jgi:hypothetical protein
MRWLSIAPQRCDFDTEEEYQEALAYYDCCEDMYAEEYYERTRN